MAIVVNSGFDIKNLDPADKRLVVANASARLGFDVNNVYEGMPVYQEDTNEFWMLTDKTYWSGSTGWSLIPYNGGSFSGSFSGSGANLYGIPASAISGLNLSQISSGSYSASISQNGGLYVNTFISASNLTGSNTGDQYLGNLLLTSSFNAYTSSNDIIVNNLTNNTGSYATTGSNIFIGNEIISGSLTTTGSGSMDILKLNSINPSTGSFEAGKIFYDVLNKTVSAMIDGDVTLQIGQEELVLVYNNTADIIPDGSVVYKTGANGDIPTVALSQANLLSTALILGVTTQAIPINGSGFATVRGIVHGLNTSTFTSNDVLYLSPTVAGGITNVMPTDLSDYVIIVGSALLINSSTGSIYVNLLGNNRLVDLIDVEVNSANVDDRLIWNGTKWVNGPRSSISAGTGTTFFLDSSLIIPSGSGPQTIPVETLLRNPSPLSQVIQTSTVTNSTAIISRFLYNTPLGITSINSGIWTFNTYGYVSNAGQASSIPVTVRKSVTGAGLVTIIGTGTTRTATVTGGTPFVAGDANTDITLSGLLRTPNGAFGIVGFTSSSQVTITTLSTYTNETSVVYSTHNFLFNDANTEVNNLTVGLTTSTSAQPAFAVELTDKLEVTYYARTTSGTAKTLYLYHNGSTYYTNFTSPIVSLHNDLPGLQGGAGNERYHLSAAEYTKATTGISNIDNTSDANKPVSTAQQTVLNLKRDKTEIGDAHGFVTPPNIGNFSISNVGSSVTITLLQNAGNYKLNGTDYVNNGLSITFTASLGQNFINLNSAGLSVSVFDLLDLTKTPVCTVNWDGTLATLGDELHRSNRNLMEHKKQHDTDGARWVSGFLTTFGSSANNTFSAASGQIRDEERYHDIAARTSATILYRNAALTAMITDEPTTRFTKLVGTTTGAPYYDNAGTLTALATSQYGIMWMYATNRKLYSKNGSANLDSCENIFVMGQGTYTSVANAQAAALPTIVGMTAVEWKLLYRVIIRNVGGALVYTQADDLRTTTTALAVSGGGLTSLPATQITETNYGNVQTAIDDLIVTNSAVISTTTDIIPDFSSDIYLISNTQAAAETAVSNSTYTNMPTRSGFRTVRFYNAFTATRTLTLYGTATLVLGGITYTFQYINSNIIAVPTLKTLEISYEFIFTSSTACTISIISALQS